MRRFERRQWLMIAPAVALGLLLAGFLGFMFLYPRLAAWTIRTSVMPRLSARINRSVVAERVLATRGTAVLEGLAVRDADDPEGAPLAHIARVDVEFDFWATLTGHVHVRRVTVTGAQVGIVRRDDGSDNMTDVVRALGIGTDPAAPGGERSASGRFSRLRPDILVIQNAALEVRDLATGVTVSAGSISATVPRTGRIDMVVGETALRTPFGPAARAGEVHITADLADPVGSAEVTVQGGEVAAHRFLSLSNISGQIKSDESPGRLLLDLSGSYGGAGEELWQASGWIEPRTGNGSVHIGAERFTFDRLDSILRDTAVIDYQDTAVSADMNIEVAGGRTSFAGTFELTGGNLRHPMIAANPVRDINVTGAIEGSYKSGARVFELSRAELKVFGVDYQISGAVHLPGGVEPDSGLRRAHPRLEAHLVVPSVPCQMMLDGVPEALRPYINGFKLRGWFHADLTVAIDWADLDATELRGDVGIGKCKVVQEPEGELGLARLEESFVHSVEVEREKWIEFVIGMENPDFVPIWDVSPHLLASLMTTEDSRFYEHHGFITREFRTALIKNLKAGYFRYGASSITMQTVKNVILHREKTLSRKFQELFFTWYIETRLTKDRIFEIYVNAIEYGPGIYGIGPAARHYFGKHPRDLNPVEAAFFSSILPAPKQRYKQYCEDRLSRWTESKIQRILKLMVKRERLTEPEYAVALDTPLVFDRTNALPVRECLLMVKRAVENAPSTNPMEAADETESH